MSEWLYAQAGQIKPLDSKLWFDLLNARLQKPTDAFDKSIIRLRKFWELAPHIMEVTAANVKALHDFIFEAGKTYQVPATEEEFNKLMISEIARRAEEKYKETGSLKEATGFDLGRGIEAFDKFLRRTTTLDEAIRALLEAQLVGAWSAFETLTEELWNATSSYFPDDFNFKPRFRRLESIRDTYKQLIPASDEINEILANNDLRKLNLVRNVLVHRAGKVDYDFLDGAEKIGWNSGEIIDRPIIINGRRVKELVNPVVKAGEDLIRALDRWITSKKAGTS